MALSPTESPFAGAAFPPPVRQDNGPWDERQPALEDEDPVIDWIRKAWRNGEFDQAPLDPEFTALSDSVGPYKTNDRYDVAKVQLLLDRAGAYDLTPTDGPTGYFGASQHRATLDYQRDNNLAVDGLIHPGGETLKSLRTEIAASDREITGSDAARADVASEPVELGTPPEIMSAIEVRAGEPASKLEPTAEPDTSAIQPTITDSATEGEQSASLGDVARRVLDVLDRALPAPALTKEQLQKFKDRSGYSLDETKSGEYELNDPESGRTLVVLSKDWAGTLVRNWDSYADRVALLTIADLTDMRAAQKMQLAEPFFSRVDTFTDGGVVIGGAGRDGASARMAMQQKIAQGERAAFADAVNSLDQGTPRDEAISKLRANLLSDMNVDFTPLELIADVSPILGQIRSVRHADNDLRDAEDARRSGMGLAAEGYDFMALLDGLGALPAINTAPTIARGAVKLMPYGGRILADRALRRMERQFEDTSHKIDVSRLFGDEWGKLESRARRRVRFDTNMAVGQAGENYAVELARAADPKTATKARHQLPERIPGASNPRIYDFAKRDLFESIRDDIVENLSRVMGRTIEAARKPIAHFEVKTGAAKKRSEQNIFDKAVNTNEELAHKIEISEVRDMRVFPEQIPAHLVISEFQQRLPGLLNDRVIDAQTGDAYLNALKREYAEGSRTVWLNDYVGLIARLVATAPRYFPANSSP